ncbi:MAG: hypothetical protein AAF985_02905 [Bacteroidota bacterium]
MEFIIAYFKGWGWSFRKIGMWLLIYVFNFLFALLATLPLLNMLESKLGRSLTIERLMPGFDFTIFSDIMNQYGDSVRVLLDQSIVLVFLFFVFSIFLNGGILHVFKLNDTPFRFRNFWTGCSRYFWRLFRLTVYFFVVYGLLSMAFFQGYFAWIGGGLDQLDSELVFYEHLRVLIPIWGLLLSVVMMIHDYAKIHIVHEDKMLLFVPFWQSFAMVFKHFLSTFSLYWLNLFTFFGVIWAYILLNRPADSNEAIIYTFVVGQAFVLARIGMKMLNLASATAYYQQEMRRPQEKTVLVSNSEVTSVGKA